MRKSSGQNRHAIAPYTRVPAADGHRVVVPGRLGGRDGCVADEPRVAGRRRIDLALEPGEHARVAQVIARQVLAAQGFAALDEQDPPARLGEHARGHPAAGSRADHDHVVLVRQVVGLDRRRCRLRRGRPARARRHGPVAEPRPRARISVVGAGRDLQDPGHGDPGRRAGIGQQLAHQRLAIGPAPGGEVGRADDRAPAPPERPVVLDRDAGHRARRRRQPAGLPICHAARSRIARGAFSRRRRALTTASAAIRAAPPPSTRRNASVNASRAESVVRGVAQRAMAVDRAAEAAEERDPERAPEVRRGRQQA